MGNTTWRTPDFDEIGQMIAYPLQAAGMAFEKNEKGERLSQVLQKAAVRDPGALPLLEYTLDQLFQICEKTEILTFDAYRRLGGLEGALARRAEEEFSRSGVSEEVLQFVLRALVTFQHGEVSVAVQRVPRRPGSNARSTANSSLNLSRHGFSSRTGPATDARSWESHMKRSCTIGTGPKIGLPRTWTSSGSGRAWRKRPPAGARKASANDLLLPSRQTVGRGYGHPPSATRRSPVGSCRVH